MIRLICGDAESILNTLSPNSAQCIITSPPYWRCVNYEHSDQIGLEETWEAYHLRIMGVVRACYTVLRDDGLLWLNIGDVYNGTGGAGGDYNAGGRKANRAKYGGRNCAQIPRKSLFGLPYCVAISMTDEGWIWRNTVAWQRSTCCAAKDRDVPNWESVFMFAKSGKYKFDRNAGLFSGSVWNIPNNDRSGHPAPFPMALAAECIARSTKANDIVLDPFCGSGTVGEAAKRMQRGFIGIDIKPEYIDMTNKRLAQEATP